jgi:hypothetical protein
MRSFLMISTAILALTLLTSSAAATDSNGPFCSGLREWRTGALDQAQKKALVALVDAAEQPPADASREELRCLGHLQRKIQHSRDRKAERCARRDQLKAEAICKVVVPFGKDGLVPAPVSYKITTLAAPLVAGEQWFSPAYTPSATWPTGSTPFGANLVCARQPGFENITKFATVFPLNSRIYARATFKIERRFKHDPIEVKLIADNDIHAVYLDGVLANAKFPQIRDGCGGVGAAATFTFPAPALGWNTREDRVLALHVSDRGVQSFLNFQIRTAAPGCRQCPTSCDMGKVLTFAPTCGCVCPPGFVEEVKGGPCVPDDDDEVAGTGDNCRDLKGRKLRGA